VRVGDETYTALHPTAPMCGVVLSRLYCWVLCPFNCVVNVLIMCCYCVANA